MDVGRKDGELCGVGRTEDWEGRGGAGERGERGEEQMGDG